MATHWTPGCDAADPHADPVERERLVRERVATLVEAGAAVDREERHGDVLGHVVVLDPEGNEFCVA